MPCSSISKSLSLSLIPKYIDFFGLILFDLKKISAADDLIPKLIPSVWSLANPDTAIAIRTAVIRDGLIHVGAGAGIVADSNPESEWLECKQKSKVFLDALEMIS